MRKRILTLMACIATFVAGFAQQAGDYFYTNEGRIKISDATNLLPNGDFSAGYEQWTTDGGTELNTDTFSIQQGGVNGKPYLLIQLKQDGPGTGSSLMRTVSVEPGTYYISYYVKCDQEVVTAIDEGKNYQNIFFNTDGSLAPERPIAKVKEYASEWTKMEYSITTTEPGYIVFHFYGNYVNTCFSQFTVMKAQQVPDDREVEAFIARLQAYLGNPLFPNEHEILEGIIEEIRSVLASDDMQTMNELIAVAETEGVAAFLDANTINVTQYLKCPNFDEANISNNQQTLIGGAWTAEGTRWLVRGAAAPFSSTYVERNYPGSGVLPEGQIYQTTNRLPPGTYMYTMKANARRYRSKKNDIYDGYEIRGLQVYLNEDATECFPIDTVKLTPYTVFSEVKEGQDITVGFYVPEGVANLVNIDDTELRVIGVTQEQIDEYYARQEFADARQTLLDAIDNARALLVDDDYFYAKQLLTDSINVSLRVYDNSTELDSITNQTKRMNRAISYFKQQNAEYTTLRATVATVDELLADESYKNGRDALTAARQEAVDFMGTLDPAVRDSLGLAQQNEKLISAINAFMIVNSDADEAYLFQEWAAPGELNLICTLADEPTVTSDGSELNAMTSNYLGHDIKGRLAFLKDKVTVEAYPDYGLTVNLPSKNLTAMAILGLHEGDEVTIDWTLANNSHGLYVTSANASYTKSDGTLVELTQTGKKAANQMDNNDNRNGLAGMQRSVFRMTADGTLDFYLGSTNSTLRVSYLGIKYFDPTGIDDVMRQGNGYVKNQRVYDLQGRQVGSVDTDSSSFALPSSLKRGIYIVNGKKYMK